MLTLSSRLVAAAIRLGRYSGHAFAFLGTAFTGFGATLAVLHIMLATFIATDAANLGADAAEVFGKFRTAGHKSGGGGTDFRASAVQLDASGHSFYVFFVEALGGAMITLDRALVAGLDTPFKFLVRHKNCSFLCRTFSGEVSAINRGIDPT